MIDMLMPYAAHVHTITADNGSEFVEHKAIAKTLGAEFYFAHPYSSWERGLNKHFNGLLRQFISKGSDLKLITDEDVQGREKLKPKASQVPWVQAARNGVLGIPSSCIKRESHFRVEFTVYQ